VAYGGHHFPLLKCFSHEAEEGFISAHPVGGIASWDDYSIKVIGSDLVGGKVYLDREAVFACVLVSGASSDNLDFSPFLFHPEEGIPKFQVLVDVFGQYGYSLTVLQLMVIYFTP
jgi:hypothetical protein